MSSTWLRRALASRHLPRERVAGVRWRLAVARGRMLHGPEGLAMCEECGEQLCWLTYEPHQGFCCGLHYLELPDGRVASEPLWWQSHADRDAQRASREEAP